MTCPGITSRIIRAWNFYAEGFRNMTVGKLLWRIILIKLLVMFAVLKPLFFTDRTGNGRTTQQKADIVLEQLTTRP